MNQKHVAIKVLFGLFVCMSLPAMAEQDDSDFYWKAAEEAKTTLKPLLRYLSLNQPEQFRELLKSSEFDPYQPLSQFGRHDSECLVTFIWKAIYENHVEGNEAWLKLFLELLSKSPSQWSLGDRGFLSDWNTTAAKIPTFKNGKMKIITVFGGWNGFIIDLLDHNCILDPEIKLQILNMIAQRKWTNLNFGDILFAMLLEEFQYEIKPYRKEFYEEVILLAKKTRKTEQILNHRSEKSRAHLGFACHAVLRTDVLQMLLDIGFNIDEKNKENKHILFYILHNTMVKDNSQSEMKELRVMANLVIDAMQTDPYDIFPKKITQHKKKRFFDSFKYYNKKNMELEKRLTEKRNLLLVTDPYINTIEHALEQRCKEQGLPKSASSIPRDLKRIIKRQLMID